MSEIKTNGFLIHRQDFQLFDEVLAFINEHGNIFSVIALGTKKILSKNARNLFYGCLSEFMFFASRDIENKLGKLKKVVLLENNIDISTRTPLLLLNAIIYKNKIKGISVFEEVKNLGRILKEFGKEFDNILIINILIKMSKYLGIKLNLNGCSHCNSKNIYSFSNDDFGFVCKDHYQSDYKISASAIELLYLVNKNKFNSAIKYEQIYQKISLRILTDYINYHSGFNLYNYLFN
ncbi:DNA repair protein RecO [Malacoplasma penetrans]|uniref:DNA repair protein RecO n=1 Tax=Malacoplasma penetrans (strain HF-2) TaxID=272633 RepID=Q8EW65_MALP2|nr:DNA repair protein RecO [Malacoplasma penetrans]RXY96630.1 DNA repair protein RecO [Malacoplasma penetrans]BAC44131.1 conserved hypothetical protein [Malacoplasma penetrans HF-2]